MFKTLKQIVKDFLLPVIDRNGWVRRQHRDAKNINKLMAANLKADSNCIDIGCHKGDFLKLFEKFAPGGKFFAFEPLPPLYDYLKKNFPRAILYDYALGDFEGKSTFNYVVNDPAWSGFKTQSYANHEVEIKEIEVPVKMLDNVIPANIPIDFIKIDVEGAEYSVLSGAKSLIKNKKPVILFEFAKIHTVNYGVTPEKFYDLFVKELGMSLFSLDLSGPLSLAQFSDKFEFSFSSNYDRDAETNFIAMYKS
jgi:FkbM family methyltransferase